MSKLLYIEASPRKSRSKSIEVAHVFLSTLQNSHSSVELDKLDLWSTELPSFDGDTVDAKYAILHGQPHTPEQAKAWKRVTDVIDRFKSADWYLFSLPMWNFGVPYVLKHLIDVIVQPGLTFSFSPTEGYKGLVTGKKATAVYARGGAYGSGTGAEAYRPAEQNPWWNLRIHRNNRRYQHLRRTDSSRPCGPRGHSQKSERARRVHRELLVVGETYRRVGVSACRRGTRSRAIRRCTF